MMFCSEMAFRPGSEAFEAIFGQQLSVDTLERLSRAMGRDADEFMEKLSAAGAETDSADGWPTQPL